MNSLSTATEGVHALVVIDPNGRRSRVPLHPFPFRIGRAPDNHLVLRDSRISRNHVQITQWDGACILEDLGSRHGVWVNGERLEKSLRLHGSERIEFGVPDGYQVHFTRSGDELQKLLARPIAAEIAGQHDASLRAGSGSIPKAGTSSPSGRSATGNLERLRAVLEVARSLQSSFSVDDVL